MDSITQPEIMQMRARINSLEVQLEGLRFMLTQSSSALKREEWVQLVSQVCQNYSSSEDVLLLGAQVLLRAEDEEACWLVAGLMHALIKADPVADRFRLCFLELLCAAASHRLPRDFLLTAARFMSQHFRDSRAQEAALQLLSRGGDRSLLMRFLDAIMTSVGSRPRARGVQRHGLSVYVRLARRNAPLAVTFLTHALTALDAFPLDGVVVPLAFEIVRLAISVDPDVTYGCISRLAAALPLNSADERVGREISGIFAQIFSRALRSTSTANTALLAMWASGESAQAMAQALEELHEFVKCNQDFIANFLLDIARVLSFFPENEVLRPFFASPAISRFVAPVVAERLPAEITRGFESGHPDGRVTVALLYTLSRARQAGAGPELSTFPRVARLLEAIGTNAELIASFVWAPPRVGAREGAAHAGRDCAPRSLEDVQVELLKEIFDKTQENPALFDKFLFRVLLTMAQFPSSEQIQRMCLQILEPACASDAERVPRAAEQLFAAILHFSNSSSILRPALNSLAMAAPPVATPPEIQAALVNVLLKYPNADELVSPALLLLSVDGLSEREAALVLPVAYRRWASRAGDQTAHKRFLEIAMKNQTLSSFPFAKDSVSATCGALAARGEDPDFQILGMRFLVRHFSPQLCSCWDVVKAAARLCAFPQHVTEAEAVVAAFFPKTLEPVFDADTLQGILPFSRASAALFEHIVQALGAMSDAQLAALEGLFPAVVDALPFHRDEPRAQPYILELVRRIVRLGSFEDAFNAWGYVWEVSIQYVQMPAVVESSVAILEALLRHRAARPQVWRADYAFENASALLGEFLAIHPAARAVCEGVSGCVLAFLERGFVFEDADEHLRVFLSFTSPQKKFVSNVAEISSILISDGRRIPCKKIMRYLAKHGDMSSAADASALAMLAGRVLALGKATPVLECVLPLFRALVEHAHSGAIAVPLVNLLDSLTSQGCREESPHSDSAGSASGDLLSQARSVKILPRVCPVLARPAFRCSVDLFSSFLEAEPLAAARDSLVSLLSRAVFDNRNCEHALDALLRLPPQEMAASPCARLYVALLFALVSLDDSPYSEHAGRVIEALAAGPRLLPLLSELYLRAIEANAGLSAGCFGLFVGALRGVEGAEAALSSLLKGIAVSEKNSAEAAFLAAEMLGGLATTPEDRSLCAAIVFSADEATRAAPPGADLPPGMPAGLCSEERCLELLAQLRGEGAGCEGRFLMALAAAAAFPAHRLLQNACSEVLRTEISFVPSAKLVTRAFETVRGFPLSELLHRAASGLLAASGSAELLRSHLAEVEMAARLFPHEATIAENLCALAAAARELPDDDVFRFISAIAPLSPFSPRLYQDALLRIINDASSEQLCAKVLAEVLPGVPRLLADPERGSADVALLLAKCSNEVPDNFFGRVEECLAPDSSWFPRLVQQLYETCSPVTLPFVLRAVSRAARGGGAPTFDSLMRAFAEEARLPPELMCGLIRGAAAADCAWRAAAVRRCVDEIPEGATAPFFGAELAELADSRGSVSNEEMSAASRTFFELAGGAPGGLALYLPYLRRHCPAVLRATVEGAASLSKALGRAREFDEQNLRAFLDALVPSAGALLRAQLVPLLSSLSALVARPEAEGLRRPFLQLCDSLQHGDRAAAGAVSRALSAVNAQGGAYVAPSQELAACTESVPGVSIVRLERTGECSGAPQGQALEGGGLVADAASDPAPPAECKAATNVRRLSALLVASLCATPPPSTVKAALALTGALGAHLPEQEEALMAGVFLNITGTRDLCEDDAEAALARISRRVSELHAGRLQDIWRAGVAALRGRFPELGAVRE
eukprot:gnl/Chilomastix_cuspidata/3275.p1 GENE.gnl/Chilomastix_cuspidata/3275~~gnl/Chilomastix_cuspidata/3275.p1  ORF type:complete len:1825 (+),score=461.26 gnl/Chilomastix_cuspidata/3275:139-5613(+)